MDRGWSDAGGVGAFPCLQCHIPPAHQAGPLHLEHAALLVFVRLICYTQEVWGLRRSTLGLSPFLLKRKKQRGKKCRLKPCVGVTRFSGHELHMECWCNKACSQFTWPNFSVAVLPTDFVTHVAVTFYIKEKDGRRGIHSLFGCQIGQRQRARVALHFIFIVSRAASQQHLLRASLASRAAHAECLLQGSWINDIINHKVC